MTKSLWTGARHGHRGLTELVSSHCFSGDGIAIHRAPMPGYRRNRHRCVSFTGDWSRQTNRWKCTCDTQRMPTPAAVLIVASRASLLGSIEGHALTVRTANTAGFNTHSEGIGPRHMGASFEPLGDQLDSEFPEPSSRSLAK